MNEGEHADGQDPIQEMSYADITAQLRQLDGKWPALEILIQAI